MSKKNENLIPNEKKGEIVTLLEAGVMTPFWAFLVKVMEQNVTYLEHQIVTKKSLEIEGGVLSDVEVDRLRDKREILNELLASPQNIIKQVQNEDIKEEELDPFFKDIKEYRKSSTLK